MLVPVLPTSATIADASFATIGFGPLPLQLLLLRFCFVVVVFLLWLFSILDVGGIHVCFCCCYCCWAPSSEVLVVLPVLLRLPLQLPVSARGLAREVHGAYAFAMHRKTLVLTMCYTCVVKSALVCY